MDVIVKTKRCIGTTTRLIEDAARNNGLYVSPTYIGKAIATENLEKKVEFKMSDLVAWSIRDLRKAGTNKRQKLYIDEGYSIGDIKSLIDDGFNIEKIVTTEQNLKDILLLKDKTPLEVSYEPKMEHVLDTKIAALMPHDNVFKKEYECIFFSVMIIPQIKNIVYDIDQGTTIVFFQDGTKEISRLMEGDIFDKEQGVAMCIMKKMFGNRSKWKRVVDSGVEKKSKSSKNEKWDNKKLVSPTAEKPKEKSIGISDMINEINKKGYTIDLDQNLDLTFHAYVYNNVQEIQLSSLNYENMISAVKEAYDYV